MGINRVSIYSIILRIAFAWVSALEASEASSEKWVKWYIRTAVCLSMIQMSLWDTTLCVTWVFHIGKRTEPLLPRTRLCRISKLWLTIFVLSSPIESLGSHRSELYEPTQEKMWITAGWSFRCMIPPALTAWNTECLSLIHLLNEYDTGTYLLNHESLDNHRVLWEICCNCSHLTRLICFPAVSPIWWNSFFHDGGATIKSMELGVLINAIGWISESETELTLDF
jgi:hypothetical protein